MRSIGTPIFLAIVLLGLACNPSSHLSNSTNKPASSSIDGKWILLELNGIKVNDAELQNERPGLEFNTTEKRVAGTTGCNRFGAAITITGQTMKMGVVAATRMACAGDLEDRFLKAMGEVNEFKIDNLSLYLMEGNTTKLMMRRPD
jgi:heat shock protein HslJ